MRGDRRRWRFSSRGIIALAFGGLLVAALVSLAISRRLAYTVSDQIKSRELEFLYGAIESGPLAIARLQAANIAQQELSRLLSHPKFSHRGLVAALIKGGPQGAFTFAIWNSGEAVDAKCKSVTSRTFQYVDALNPFVVALTRDDCAVLSEERDILVFSSVASLLVAAISALLLAGSLWPAALSMQKAQRVLASDTTDSEAVEDIAYTPVRSLVRLALRNIKLEREAALSRIAAQVSHDIRSPLSALKIVVETLKDLPPDKRQILQHAAERIQNIANDLLSDRKQSLQQSEFVSSLSGPNVLIKSVLESVIVEKRLQYQARPEVQLRFEYTLADAAIVVFSASDLARILSNLINNAYEAIQGPGSVTVAARPAGSKIQIVVADTGSGIATEVLSKLGEAGASFGKVTSLNAGSGLGLHHAHKIISAAGGTLKIHSKVNVGTQVILTLI